MNEPTVEPVLRLATPKDAAGVWEIYAPIVRDTAISFEVEVPPLDEMARRISSTLEQHPWLVAVEAESVLGYAYAGTHRSRAAYQWSCEVSVYVHDTAHRRGLATQLYRALIALLKLQGFATIFAGITQPNPKSVALHQAMGFEVVGTFENVGLKNGIWRDVQWWQQRLDSKDPANREDPLRQAPLGLPNLLADPELRAGLAAILSGS